MRFAAILFGLAAIPALADGLSDLAFPTDGSCYLRHYDQPHLESHPTQQVVEIALGPETAEFAAGAEPIVLRVQVRTRKAATPFRGVAYCEGAGKALSCLMGGDAGAFTLQPASGNRLHLTVAQGGMSFEGETEFYTSSGSSGDDREFLIPPVPADSCP